MDGKSMSGPSRETEPGDLAKGCADLGVAGCGLYLLLMIGGGALLVGIVLVGACFQAIF